MTATDTTSALLAAICADPSDDVRRLAFADHLDERGGDGDAERAEFIRVQCELARQTAEPWDMSFGECWQCRCARNGRQHTNGPCRCLSRFKALRQRVRELFQSITFGDVFGHDKPLQALRVTDREFRLCELPSKGLVSRGFVESVTCSAEDWLRHADALLASHPVTAVTLTTPVHWVARGYDGAPFRLYEDPHGVEVSDEDVGRELRRTRGTDDAIDILTAILRVRWPGVTFTLPPH